MDVWVLVASLLFTLFLFATLVIGIRRGWIPAVASLEDEYKEKVEEVKQSCEERIAALRVDYEKRIRELEHHVNILLQLVYEFWSTPEIAAIEQQYQASKAKLANDRRPVYVLGIWPESNLDTASEKNAVRDAGFQYRALTGKGVTRNKIIREFQAGNVTILEIGAHGDKTGIMVNNSNYSAGWWENVLRNYTVEIAVLLACHSDSLVADAMKRAGVKYVIAVDGEIADGAAVEFAQQFYQQYANGQTVQQAVYFAKLALDPNDAEKILLR